MEKKRNNNIAALISIEPDLIKMRISRLKNNNLVDIERLERSTKIGHEIFNNGKISFESLREMSSILKGYSKVLSEYNVKSCRVIASTLLNDAENCTYIIDQLKIQNNMNVEILEDRQEKSLIYFEMISIIEQSDYKDFNNALISFIGAGSIGLSLYDREKILFSQSIDMGSSKLYELLEPIQEQTSDFSAVVEEYLDRIIGRIKLPLNKQDIETLIISGNEINIIAKICGTKENKCIYDITPQSINEFYNEIKNMNTQTISEQYDVDLKSAQFLFITLAIYSKILKMTNAKKILSPRIELWDAIMRQVLLSKIEKQYEEHVRVSAICCAKVLSRHFCFSEKHLEYTYQYATLIFNTLKKLHGLDKRKKLLLDLAVILHESGYYINSKDPRINTFDIIKNLDLYGLTEREVNLVANIVRYNEFTSPNRSDIEYVKLPDADRLLISKMAAIFRVCNALDKSKKQKLKNVKVKLSNESLTITAESDQNVYLEKWAVDKCKRFFEDVFGIKIKLVVKTSLL